MYMLLLYQHVAICCFLIEGMCASKQSEDSAHCPPQDRLEALTLQDQNMNDQFQPLEPMEGKDISFITVIV